MLWDWEPWDWESEPDPEPEPEPERGPILLALALSFGNLSVSLRYPYSHVDLWFAGTAPRRWERPEQQIMHMHLLLGITVIATVEHAIPSPPESLSIIFKSNYSAWP
jgi:hypothetical protein